MLLSFENITALNKVAQTLLTAGVKKKWCVLHLNKIDARLYYRKKIRAFSLWGMDLPGVLVVYETRMVKLKGNKHLRFALGQEVVADPSLAMFLCSLPASAPALWGVKAEHRFVRLWVRKFVYLEKRGARLTGARKSNSAWLCWDVAHYMWKMKQILNEDEYEVREPLYFFFPVLWVWVWIGEVLCLLGEPWCFTHAGVLPRRNKAYVYFYAFWFVPLLFFSHLHQNKYTV